MVRVQFHKGDAVWFVMPEVGNTMARAVWVRAVKGGGIIQLVGSGWEGDVPRAGGAGRFAAS